MKNQICSITLLLCFLFLIFPSPTVSKAKKGGNGTCKPSGMLMKDSGCKGKIFKCSPPVTNHTKATLTVNSFEKGGEGGGPSECDGKYHSNDELIVALSTGWYNNGSRCGKFIYIFANGKKVKAKVVDECDSTQGCNAEHAGQPPCANNIVDGSKAVWKALGVSPNRGVLQVYWTDA